jgi:hypothetical protein
MRDLRQGRSARGRGGAARGDRRRARGAAMIPNVLSIAGVDPSGGAGLLADVK